MDISTLLLIVIAVGALFAWLMPRFARVAGYLVMIGSVVGSYKVYAGFAHDPSAGEFGRGIVMVIGGGAALIVLVIGVALGIGMVNGASALARPALDDLPGVGDGPNKDG